MMLLISFDMWLDRNRVEENWRANIKVEKQLEFWFKNLMEKKTNLGEIIWKSFKFFIEKFKIPVAGFVIDYNCEI